MKKGISENLIFTADDWGLSPKVNEGILELAKLGIVKRVSVLANADYVDLKLAELRNLPKIELGIHFNCTFGKAPKTFNSIAHRQEFLGVFGFCSSWVTNNRRARSEVSRNLLWQLELLNNHRIQPTYIDGHHHVHLFPGTLSAILPIIKGTSIKTIRTLFDTKNLSAKKAFLYVLSMSAKNRILESGLKTMPCYYPILKEMTATNFAEITYPTEIVIHPASEVDFDQFKIRDPYQAGRVSEFKRLSELFT